ncbi:MAG: hypothetical protein K2L11_11980 [Muribaculaceae bacterium]|nr:hypothetical protein [Muribaculaceae bacterium]
MKQHIKCFFALLGLFACSSNDTASYIPEMGIFIRPDYDSHRINFYKSPADSPDFVEFRGYGHPEIKYYPSARLFFLSPDTILVVPQQDHILKIHENRFKILVCESDSSGYFSNLSHIGHRYPKGTIHPYPKQKHFEINVSHYFYYMWITDSLGDTIFAKRFKDLDEIKIPR